MSKFQILDGLPAVSGWFAPLRVFDGAVGHFSGALPFDALVPLIVFALAFRVLRPALFHRQSPHATIVDPTRQ